jgi:hypothetical protein
MFHLVHKVLYFEVILRARNEAESRTHFNNALQRLCHRKVLAQGPDGMRSLSFALSHLFLLLHRAYPVC